MSTKKKQPQQQQEEETKIKLRTAAEVIARLKWSYDEGDANEQNTVMGYDCRINGPLEKPVQDYKNINEGGDIPEHRIQYFRRTDDNVESYNKSFLWDRIGRVDRLFGSGEGADAPISPITLQNAQQALQTMKQLAEKRAILAEEKVKRRARQQAAKALAIKKLNASMSPQTSEGQNGENDGTGVASFRERHTWTSCDYFHTFEESTSSWVERPFMVGKAKNTKQSEPAKDANLKIITWNVLFDLQRNDKNELIQGDNSLLGGIDHTLTRWDKLIQTLSRENADVIALQEVTPRFLEVLLSHEWVKSHYASSASMSDLKSLATYGTLTIWRHSCFVPVGMYMCQDVHRNRAMIVSLEDSKAGILNVANVHLPADQHSSNGITIDRTLARQKELGAVIAKLQVLEQTQTANGSSNVRAIPLVLGDFNSGDQDAELYHPNFFSDAWIHCHKNSDQDNKNGFTFDWQSNRRADKTRQFGHSDRGPRRIDRILIGKSPTADLVLFPTAATVLGKIPNDEFPPSDHYGVCVSLMVAEDGKNKQPGNMMYDSKRAGHNAWAASAAPTTECLLALILRDDHACVKGTELRDLSSSLPIPHLTLLNGFVDLSSDETRHVSMQAVADAVRQSLYSSDPAKIWSLPITHSSLRAFEHQLSATLVCVPDIESPEGEWLSRLYETLRAVFPLCHEQESRFASGWTPHLSVGTFSGASDARDVIDKIRSSDAWVQDNESAYMLPAYGIGLFRRDAMDGKFYPVTTVPLVEKRQRDIRIGDSKSFANDVGLAWSSSWMGASTTVLQELDRACQYANNKLHGGRLETAVCVYGSHAFGVSLPGISDLDTIVTIRSKTADGDSIVRSMSDNQFLNCIASRLSSLHKGAKTRARLSSNPNGAALFLLTVKLSPQSPSLDVMLCRTDSSGVPINSIGQTAIHTIQDSKYIQSSVSEIPFCPINGGLDNWEVFQGALRIIKLWAVRREIYGTSTGYLGGGGWAVLLLWVLQQQQQQQQQQQTTNLEIDGACDLSSAVRQLVVHFFQNITKLYAASNHVVDVSKDPNHHKELIEQMAGVVSSRGSMSVLAPISGGDFGRSTTTSTTKTIWDEIRRAQEIVNQHQQNEDVVENLISVPFDLATSGVGCVLALEVQIPPGTKPSEMRAWGATRALNLTVSLSPECNDVRLSTRVLKRGKSFWYFWGIHDDASSVGVDDTLSKLSDDLEESCRISHRSSVAKLSKLTREEYTERFG